MASHTCEHCGAVVASDEQFCPSCGTFIDPMKATRTRSRRSSGGNVISVSSDGPSDSSYEEFSLETPPSSDRPPAPAPRQSQSGNGNGGDGPVSCPSCGAVNPANNRHCQECGARLRQGPLPTAPRPAVQATAGVRAALAISGLLLGVILIALFFNVFNGEDPEATGSTTTTSTTVAAITNPAPIEVLTENCQPEGIGGFVCANLTNGAGNEYQVSWEEVANDGVTITLEFRELIAVTSIEWTNIEDETRFRQNYRAQSLLIRADDSLDAIPVNLQNQPGTQLIRYSSLNTARLVIEIVEAYDAEVVDDNRWDELAIDEIVVIGRPVIPTSNTTVPGTGETTTPDASTTTTP